MEHYGNDNKRKGNSLTANEYLQKMGIAQTVEDFLGKEEMNALTHERFVAGCEEVKGKIQKMPAHLHEKLEHDLQWFEQQQEPGFAEYAFDYFKTALARMIEFSCMYLSENAKAKVIEAWKDDLKNSADGVIQIAKTAVEYAEAAKMREFVSTWLLYLSMVHSDEDVMTILEVVHGDSVSAIDRLMAGILSAED